MGSRKLLRVRRKIPPLKEMVYVPDKSVGESNFLGRLLDVLCNARSSFHPMYSTLIDSSISEIRK